MELINPAEKQIENMADPSITSPFFKEYFRSFNSNAHFDEDTSQLMREHTLQDVTETVSFLKRMSEEALRRMNNQLNSDIDIGIITFFGDGRYDGHGILIDGEPYVFFDLNAIIPRIDHYNFTAFITHEMLHGIHYALNPDFYPGNHRKAEEKYLKLLFSEGIATHLSYVLSHEKIEDTYWLGYLESEQVREWVKNCEKMKDDIGADLHQAIEAGQFDNALYHRLFGIDDFTALTSYRTGYYYGAEIVKGYLAERHMHDVLTLDYSEAKDLINEYF